MDGSLKTGGRLAVFLTAAVIVGGGLAAYANSFHGPFVFDDLPAVLENPTIRSWSRAWSPPVGGISVSGRPLLNASFALNYAFSGERVWGYHLLNLTIHLLAGLTLFGVARRTMLGLPAPAPAGAFVVGAANPSVAIRSRSLGAGEGVVFAGAIALLWTLHPLQTESVTYVVQRAESLVGLFYLLTLYGFIRAAATGRVWPWGALSLTACWLGMATKEVMATAPLLLWLYDRTFLAGSFRAAWNRRRGLYTGYAASWCLLAALVIRTGNRGGTAGFGLNITPGEYLLTQGQAIGRYLGLTIWPRPLVLDYGLYVARGSLAIVPFVALVTALVAATLVALRRSPVAGFLGAAFLLLLAPTSSVIPVATQTMAEHRMYLALAVIVTAVVWITHRWLERVGWIVLALLAVVLGGLTAARNADYADARVLWADVVAKRPENFRARYNLALQAMDRGLIDEAVAQSREAVRRAPDNSDAHFNFGLILFRVGRTAEAVEETDEALRLRPGFADAHVALGNARLKQGRLDAAIGEFETAIRLQPNSADAQNNLGGALTKAGRAADALPHFDAALRLKGESASAHSNRGEALSQLGRTDEALAEIETALALQPDLAEAHYALASALLRVRRASEALPHFETALRLNPAFAEAHLLFGSALVNLGRAEEGLAHFAEALRLNPDSFEAHFNYANALLQLARPAEAIAQYRDSLRLQPELTAAHYNLAHAFLQENRFDDAAREFEATLRLDPNHVDAHYNLGNCRLIAGRPDEAAKEFEEVVRRVPASVDAHFLLGNALMQLHRPAEAISHYEEVLRLKPDYPEASANLARTRAEVSGSLRP